MRKEKVIIIIADKSRHVCEFLRREFENEGFSAKTAGDGRRLFAYLDVDDQPDVLVLDLDLPYTGGIDVLLRLQNRTPPVPVVVHTDHIELRDHPAVRGADGFVEKRGNPENLKRVVMEILEKHSPEKVRALNNSGGAWRTQ